MSVTMWPDLNSVIVPTDCETHTATAPVEAVSPAGAARPKRDVRAALAGQRPRLVLITGVGSVAADGLRAQLREAEADLDLHVVRVSMHEPRAVARALRQASDAQAVAITRGGGQTVHDLDDDELIGAVASSPVPVLVALGHASDDLVLGQAADARRFGDRIEPEWGVGSIRRPTPGLTPTSRRRRGSVALRPRGLLAQAVGSSTRSSDFGL
jgi:hypothetical protein